MTAPETPPMTLREFLTKSAAHFQAWEEDFCDYAEDYCNEEEARERAAELARMLELSAAADYWRRHCPTP